MEFCCCVVNPEIDWPTRKWLMAKQAVDAPAELA